MNPSPYRAAIPRLIFVSTALVLLMLPGASAFYVASASRRGPEHADDELRRVRTRHVQWVLFGVRAAFGTGGVIGNLDWAGLVGVGQKVGPYSSTIPHVAFAAFQVMFAGITVALISGAMVERIRFRAYLVFALLWTTLVYDPIAHWVWASDGWLRKLGALDFAGGTVVHVSAGTAAFVAAIMLGRRRDVGRTALRPHNIVFTVIGAGLLWIGWLGFTRGQPSLPMASPRRRLSHARAAGRSDRWLAIETCALGNQPPSEVRRRRRRTRRNHAAAGS